MQCPNLILNGNVGQIPCRGRRISAWNLFLLDVFTQLYSYSLPFLHAIACISDRTAPHSKWRINWVHAVPNLICCSSSCFHCFSKLNFLPFSFADPLFWVTVPLWPFSAFALLFKLWILDLWRSLNRVHQPIVDILAYPNGLRIGMRSVSPSALALARSSVNQQEVSTTKLQRQQLLQTRLRVESYVH